MAPAKRRRSCNRQPNRAGLRHGAGRELRRQSNAKLPLPREKVGAVAVAVGVGVAVAIESEVALPLGEIVAVDGAVAVEVGRRCTRTIRTRLRQATGRAGSPGCRPTEPARARPGRRPRTWRPVGRRASRVERRPRESSSTRRQTRRRRRSSAAASAAPCDGNSGSATIRPRVGRVVDDVGSRWSESAAPPFQ